MLLTLELNHHQLPTLIYDNIVTTIFKVSTITALQPTNPKHPTQNVCCSR